MAFDFKLIVICDCIRIFHCFHLIVSGNNDFHSMLFTKLRKIIDQFFVHDFRFSESSTISTINCDDVFIGCSNDFLMSKLFKPICRIKSESIELFWFSNESLYASAYIIPCLDSFFFMHIVQHIESTFGADCCRIWCAINE